VDTEIRKRLRWVELFEALKNSAIVCRRCRISRPTLRKWVERYRSDGLVGLSSRSKRPNTSPNVRISERERTWIVGLRGRGLGSRRIQSELKRTHVFDVSRPTLEKVLKTLSPRRRLVRLLPRKGRKRYAKEVPGDRVQMDTCKIGPGVYQYTAIDDCTRIQCWRCFRVAPPRTHFCFWN